MQLVLWSLLSHPSIAFPPVYPQQTVQTGLGQLPGNKCWPTLLARRELEDKLPNTGWDQIETEKGDASLEGGEKRRERCGFSDGGMVPKGIEVKRTRALICNSNEACLQ